ncbi:MAG: single-stranded DNA-binding protein [Acidimicrobiales bacterium]
MSTAVPLPGVNLSLLVGSLSRAPELRSLPSGDTVLELQLSIRTADGPVESVPVSWFEPAPSAVGWSTGDVVAVVGRVRRRFFRAAGATASRTEVVAAVVVPARRRSAVDKAFAQAVDGLPASFLHR